MASAVGNRTEGRSLQLDEELLSDTGGRWVERESYPEGVSELQGHGPSQDAKTN